MRNQTYTRKPAHANAGELRALMERHFQEDDLHDLKLRFVKGGELPDAAVLEVDGCELRLERDYLDGMWTVATNEVCPRLLTRFEDAQLGSPLVAILRECRRQLLDD